MNRTQSPFAPRALGALVLGCTALACAAVRPPLASAWCAGEDDKACGERYAALYASANLFAPDDGNREGMTSWFRYRCGVEPGSKESAEGANEPGLDCFRAGQLVLAGGDAARARELAERGCAEFDTPEACVMAGAFAREKFNLRLAHELECRAKRGAEERAEQLAGLDGLDCDLGSDSRARLREAELAKLGRPGAPVSLVSCALHGCTLSSGRRVEKWILDWSP